MKQALAIVDNDMNIHKARKTFHILYSFLQKWCYVQRTSKKKGDIGVLNLEEEQVLIQVLLRMCKMRHDRSLTTLKLKVYEITKSRWSPFKNGFLGAR